MKRKEELTGGRIGKIYKVEKEIIRPSYKWTKSVHDFLDFIIDKGADFVPKPLGINENGEEIISYMPGDVFNYPLPNKLLTDSMIVSAAKLLLKYHNYSKKYVDKLINNKGWMLPANYPIEVMCHGDFAPYNVTIVNDQANGIIDFDTLHPGAKMWDIVYAVYRWVPFKNPNNPASYQSIQEQIRKAKLFLDTYGVGIKTRDSFTELLIKRLISLIDYMKKEAKAGMRIFNLILRKVIYSFILMM